MTQPSVLTHLSARLELDLLTPETMIQTAIEFLNEGFDTPSLVLLAGLLASEAADQGPMLMKNVLIELGVPKPTRTEAVRIVGKLIAAEILSGRTHAYDGADSISRLTLMSDDHLSEFDSFVYAASEWEDRPEDRHVFEEGILRAARDLVAHGTGEASLPRYGLD